MKKLERINTKKCIIYFFIIKSWTGTVKCPMSIISSQLSPPTTKKIVNITPQELQKTK
jgi:hypothetical protein